MKTRDQATLLKSLEMIGEQATTQPLGQFERGMYWDGDDGFFTLPEQAAHEFLNLIGKLAQEEPWSDRFSEAYLQEHLVPILKAVQANNREVAGRLLDDLIEEVDSYSLEQVVYVPVQGVSLSIGRLELGQVVLRTLDERASNEVETHIQRIYAERSGNLPRRELKDAQRSQFTEKSRKKVWAEFRTIAEPIRARELAEQETRRALELLTFANAALFPFHVQADAVVGLDGDHPIFMPWIAVTSGGSIQDFTQRARTSWNVSITASMLDHLEQVGAFVLSDLLSQPSHPVTGFDEMLLRAVHWFATSQAQAELENRLLNLTTSLEVLLAPRDGMRIAATIAERTALIIAGEGDRREQVKKFVRKLYRARSGVSHGGAKAVAEADVLQLRWIAAELITTVLRWRTDIRTREELHTWLETVQPTDGLLSPPTAPGQPKPLRQLREKRGWTQEDLASWCGKDLRLIDYWEKPGIRPDIGALRRFADIFGIRPEDIAVQPVDRWVIVQEHRFLLTARRQGPGKWVARIDGWDPSDAVEWPRRAVDQEHPHADSPSIIVGNWETTGITADRALSALATRIVTSMERALYPDRLPDDPPEWQPPDIPYHWRQHLQARQGNGH